MTNVLTVSGIFCFIFSEFFIDLFVQNDIEGGLETIEIGKEVLKYNSIVFPLLSLNVITNMTYQSIGMKWKSTLLSSCRQGIFFIPIIILVPMALELLGVEIAQASADLCTFVFTIPFFVLFMRKLRLASKMEEAKMQEAI